VPVSQTRPHDFSSSPEVPLLERVIAERDSLLLVKEEYRQWKEGFQSVLTDLLELVQGQCPPSRDPTLGEDIRRARGALSDLRSRWDQSVKERQGKEECLQTKLDGFSRQYEAQAEAKRVTKAPLEETLGTLEREVRRPARASSANKDGETTLQREDHQEPLPPPPPPPLSLPAQGLLLQKEVQRAEDECTAHQHILSAPDQSREIEVLRSETQRLQTEIELLRSQQLHLPDRSLEIMELRQALNRSEMENERMRVFMKSVSVSQVVLRQ